MGRSFYGSLGGRDQVNVNGPAANISDPTDTISAQMERLSYELREMSKLVLGRRSDSTETFRQATHVSGDKSKDLAAIVQSTIRSRLERAKHFPANIFADPAWDMLLDLFQTELLQRRTSVTDLCTASQVPATTALRWITNLINVGLIARRPDPLDGRRVFIELTDDGRQSLYSYFEAIRENLTPRAN